MGKTSRAINEQLSIIQLVQKTEAIINEAGIPDLHTAFMHINADDLKDIKCAIGKNLDYEKLGKSALKIIYRYFHDQVLINERALRKINQGVNNE